MDEVKIEKCIPLPPRGRTTKYPWASLEVGDSFVVPDNKCGTATSLAKNATKRYEPKRFIHGKHANIYRVWRTE